MVDVISKDKCTGCKMCGDLCPQNAIYFESDKEGFWYPKIDEKKCNGCGLCEEKCPTLHPEMIKQKNKLDVYAAWSKKSHVRDESTSGGVFWEIATEFIKNDGVVVGTKWNDDCKSASFYIANNFEELKKIRGSKYIQSNASGIFNAVKELLLQGKEVLFCGTPCQNAALRSFMSGRDENIFYFDFICRNVNSTKALDAYVTDMEKRYNSKVRFIRQKSKKTGWQSLATNIIFENGEELILGREEDPWIKGFIENDLYTRDSCFNCQYRTLPRRCSDITVGDFWRINNVSCYDLYKGISVVIINSEKGENLFHSIKDKLFFEKRTIEEVLEGNPALLKDPTDNGNKKAFFQYLETGGFIESVEKVIGKIVNTEDGPEQSLEIDKSRYRHNGDIDEELYMYLNYQCKNVIRKGKAKIIPYKNVILDIQNDSKIILEGDKDFEIGFNLLKGSRIETLIRLGKSAKIILHHGGFLSYGTTLEVKDNAIFEAGYFSANTGSVFIVDKKVYFGEDVMIGRNVMIYDSDFHQVINYSGEPTNLPQEVVIEDHVWLTSNTNVNKGTHINEGTIIANQTVIYGNIPEYSLVAGKSNGKVHKNDVRWSRNKTKKYTKEFSERKIILYGFGIEGKKFEDLYKDRIEYIIDNKQNAEGVITFDEFVRTSIDVLNNTDEWMCVIAAPNYYDSLYEQIKGYIPELLVISYTEV